MKKLTEHDLDAAQRRRVSPFYTANGGDLIDTAQMLAAGTITGPYRRTRPATMTLRMRVARVLRSFLSNHRSPIV